MNENIIEVSNLRKHFKSKDGVVKSVDGVTFSISKGEILGVIGESGCGKSTLAKLIIGLDIPTSGEIKFENKNILKLLKKDRLSFRYNAQMIFQNPYDVFDPKLKIEDVLMVPLKIMNIGNKRSDKIEIIKESLYKAGFKNMDDILKRYPRELSGGQLQRISIVRGELLKPKFIIADEPVSMLDVSIRADIINMLIDIKNNRNVSMLYISHDIPTTQFLVDRIMVMYLGRIVEIGATSDVINNPHHPYTKALLSYVSSVDPTKKSEHIKIYGEVPKPIGTGPGCYFYNRCYRKCDKCKNNYPDFTEVKKNHYISCFNPL